jgi:uncharacterized protein
VNGDAADTIFPSAYVGPEDLVGRNRLLDDVVLRLRTGRNVVLMAPRRVGKTSIARDVLRRLQKHDILTAYVDLFGTTDKRQFAERIAVELHEQRLGKRLRVLAEHMPNFKPHIGFAMMEFGVDISAKEADDNKVFANALELPEKAAAKRQTRAVLCLDELQEAETTFGANTYKVMRASFQQQAHTSHLFLGSQHSMLRRVFAASNAPFLRYADILDVPSIPAAEWAAYIATKFNHHKIGCSRHLALRIAERAGCHPADTMVLCGNLYYRAKALRADTLDDELLEAAVHESKAQLKTYFDALWSELHERAKERLVAARIARGEPLTRGIHQYEASRAIAALMDKGIVVRTGRGAYQYFEPLFKEYVLAL